MSVIVLWRGRLQDTEAIAQGDWQLLDEVERSRALKLKTSVMQAGYVETHARVRKILARYVQAAPEHIVIKTEPQGKPYLPDHLDWAFNLSHSGRYFVLAIAKNCRLGVDVEQYRLRANVQGLVQKCFAAEEAEYWYALPGGEQNVAFYRFWTRKEAFVKATGRGIALGLAQCVVDPCNPQAMLRVPEDCAPASAWTIVDVDWAEAMACAIVHDGGQRVIEVHDMVGCEC